MSSVYIYIFIYHEAGDLRCYRAHYDIIVIYPQNYGDVNNDNANFFLFFAFLLIVAYAAYSLLKFLFSLWWKW